MNSITAALELSSRHPTPPHLHMVSSAYSFTIVQSFMIYIYLDSAVHTSIAAPYLYI